MHVVVRTLVARPGSEIELEHAIGPGSPVVKALQRADGFIARELLRQISGEGLYALVDHWASPAARSAFEEASAGLLGEAAAAELRLCAAVTPVGEFLSLGKTRED